MISKLLPLESPREILYNFINDQLIDYRNFHYRETNMNIIKVSATSRTSAVAGAIAGVIREHKKAEVQSIGAGAVNQAVKAMILANGYLKEEGITIACTPEFVDVEIEEKVRTAIKFVVKPYEYVAPEVVYAPPVSGDSEDTAPAEGFEEPEDPDQSA